MSRSNHMMTLAAADKVSAVIDRIAGKFPNLTNSIKKSSIEMSLYKRRTEKVTKSLNSIGGKMKSVGGKMTLGLTAPIAAMGAMSFKSALDFEKGMNKVEALSGASGDALAKMREQAKKLGIETQFSASEAASAMGFLGMAGWKTEQIMSGIPGVLDLAAASGIELGRAADIASNIMGAFKINASDAGKAADILARTTASSNVDMEMLAETMKYAAPVAYKFGASLEDTATLAGLLGNIGIQGSNAGTAIKNAMLGIAAPGGKAKKILEAMGVTVSDSKGKLKPFADIMKGLGKSLNQLPQAEQLQVVDEVFGKISIAGASELIDSITKVGETGKTNFDALSERINDTTRTAKSMAETMNKGAPGAVKSLASAFEGFQIALMESGVLEVITQIMTKVTMLLRSISQNSGLMKFIAIFGTIAAVLGPVILIFGQIATAVSSVITLIGIIGPIITGIGGVIAAMAGVVSAPILAIGAVIAGVIALVYKFRKEIAGGFLSAVEKVKGFFGFGSSNESSTGNSSLPAVQNNLVEKKNVSESLVTLMLPSGVKAKTDGPIKGLNFATGGMGMSF